MPQMPGRRWRWNLFGKSEKFSAWVKAQKCWALPRQAQPGCWSGRALGQVLPWALPSQTLIPVSSTLYVFPPFSPSRSLALGSPSLAWQWHCLCSWQLLSGVFSKRSCAPSLPQHPPFPANLLPFILQTTNISYLVTLLCSWALGERAWALVQGQQLSDKHKQHGNKQWGFGEPPFHKKRGGGGRKQTWNLSC